jgi:transcriptional activator of cad operon
MRLLLCLAEHAGEVVSIEELLEQVWPDVVVSADSVYQAVASLRRLLRDDPRKPSYIATVPRRGYRMMAAVSSTATGVEPPRRGHRGAWLGIVTAIVGVALGAVLLVHGRLANSAEPSNPLPCCRFWT